MFSPASSVPQTMFRPWVFQVPQTMLVANALDVGFSLPPRTRLFPQMMCLLQLEVDGYGTPDECA